MNLLGNLIWLVCGGLISAILWWFVGAVWCLTIIGIPFGRQYFKIAKLALFPFGARIVKRR